MIPKNIERRIRQHIQAKKHIFFAVVQPGFEETALNEISFIGAEISDITIIEGGIEFRAGIREVWKINYRSRTVTRILMRISKFKSLYFEKFRNHILTIPWELYLKPDMLPDFSIKCRHSKLYHTGRLEEECRKGIAERMEKIYPGKSMRESSGTRTVYLRFEDDICTVSIDTTGEPLYKRGIRKHMTKAPIRETLASCILYEAGIENFDAVVDPMCGSGVIPLEAAFILNDIPAGIMRNFAFEDWPCHSGKAFDYIKRKSDNKFNALSCKIDIFASDIDEKAVEISRFNFEKSGIPVKIHITCKDFFSLKREDFSEGRLLIAFNPPYGGRINMNDIFGFYFRIGEKLRKDFSGSLCALVLPASNAEKALGITPVKRIPFINGGKKVVLHIGKC